MEEPACVRRDAEVGQSFTRKGTRNARVYPGSSFGGGRGGNIGGRPVGPGGLAGPDGPLTWLDIDCMVSCFLRNDLTGRNLPNVVGIGHRSD